MPRGKLIVLEGLDRAGKTTQCQLLVAALQKDGHKVKFMRFPDRTTPIGKMIDSYLSGQTEQEDHVIHLLFSANRWEAVPTIHTALSSGTTLIIDRYHHSGLVYTAAKQNPALSLPWCRSPDIGLPLPDLCLFLDISAEEAAQRGGYGGEKYEEKGMQERVRGLFEEVMRRDGGVRRVDAGGGVEEVHGLIREEVERCLGRGDDGEVGVVGEW